MPSPSEPVSAVFDFQSHQNMSNGSKENGNIICTVVKYGETFNDTLVCKI